MRKKQDRRRWQRLPLAIPVFVKGITGDGQEFVEFATAINISAGGAQLAMQRYLPPRSKISVEIPCSVGHGHTVKSGIKSSLSAKILSGAPTKSEQFHLLGLKFSRPLIQDRRIITPKRARTSSKVLARLGSRLGPGRARKAPRAAK